jgi:hypothetical protein
MLITKPENHGLAFEVLGPASQVFEDAFHFDVFRARTNVLASVIKVVTLNPITRETVVQEYSLHLLEIRLPAPLTAKSVTR